MTGSQRFLIERAIGLLEGASFFAPPEVQQALTVAVQMLDDSVKDIEKSEA